MNRDSYGRESVSGGAVGPEIVLAGEILDTDDVDELVSALDRAIAGLDPVDQARYIGRFRETILDGLPNQWMLHWNRQVARGHCFWASDRRGKRRSQQVARAHPQDRRRDGFAILISLEHK